MKKLVLLICMFAATITFANDYKPADCTVSLSPYDCIKSRTTVQCFKSSWQGKEYIVYVRTAPYGVSDDGYQVDYSDPRQGGLNLINRVFRTKEEALSNFVKEVYGSSCGYSYK